MQNYRVFDQSYDSRLYMHNDTEVQFTNHEAEVPASVAYHMSRTPSYEEFVMDKKLIPYNKDSWIKEKRVIWGGNVSTANGFGMVAENTIKELLKLGANVQTWGGLSGNQISGSENVDPLVLKAIGHDINPDCIEVQHLQPPAFKDTIVERKWIYTMFETTHTPKSWIPYLNKAERIIVPSSWLVQSWKDQGVTKPIHVVGHGIDPEVYYYMDRPVRDTYTFVHYGQLSTRKGTDLVAKAFAEEFANETDARLIVKNTYPFFPIPYNIPWTEYISATYTKDEMREFLFNTDCMVFPTRGEGFGLPPFEAMATGLPTIVTNWGGSADYIDTDDTLALNYKMGRAYEFDHIYDKFWAEGENAGDWAEPDIAHLKSQMRWAYEHREEAKAMGKKAAERIARDWTWAVQIKKLYDIIDQNA